MSNENNQENNFSRRKFITSVAGLSAAFAAGTIADRNIFSKEANASHGLSKKTLTFFGEHQNGIINLAPKSAIFCSFNITTTTKQSLSELLQILTVEIEKLTQGINYNENDKKYPPKDNMLTSDARFTDELTITLGLGASVFDNRFGLADKKPIELIEMPAFPNDQYDESSLHGDLVIQICAQHDETCFRALRILMAASNDSLVLKWLEQGFIQPNTLSKGKTSTRNLMGFKDGSANPDVNNSQLMNELIWVNKNSNEPLWAKGGTYMVVRSIRMFVEKWDKVSLGAQEKIFGRNKKNGIAFGSKNEDDIPKFHVNPTSDQVSLDSHIALANPHSKESEKNIILRRSYNYSQGIDELGLLDQGLIFVCFQNSLNNGFLTVQERLNGEELEKYVKPTGGGFFFILPGVNKGAFFGEKLFD